jgi:hypothetical protein
MLEDERAMPYTPKGIAQMEELQKALNALAPWRADTEVVRWEYQINEDRNGEPALYLTFVLRDHATTREKLGEVTPRIRNLVVDKVDPRGEWNLFPYFRFISQSDGEQLRARAAK